jgi:hypothetical protein
MSYSCFGEKIDFCVANKSFWDLTFRVEPFIRRFAEIYYSGEFAVMVSSEIGIIGLGVLKLDRSFNQKQVENFDSIATEEIVLKVSYKNYKRINVKRYDASIAYSIAFNTALKNVFYREYIIYMYTCSEQLSDLGLHVNYTELTTQFLLKYDVAGEDINVRSLRQVFDRNKKGRAEKLKSLS